MNSNSVHFKMKLDLDSINMYKNSARCISITNEYINKISTGITHGNQIQLHNRFQYIPFDKAIFY